MSTTSLNDGQHSNNINKNEENECLKASTTTENDNSINKCDLETAPKPRICHLKKWPHFQGYGFNLHAEKSKLSQHIGKVDARSPAESAGLREGDRIIEVNNVNIHKETHQQVVKRIRSGLERDDQLFDDEVLLFVIDKQGEEYYKNLNIVLKRDFPNVIRLKTASAPPSPANSPTTTPKTTESSPEEDAQLPSEPPQVEPESTQNEVQNQTDTVDNSDTSRIESLEQSADQSEENHDKDLDKSSSLNESLYNDKENLNNKLKSPSFAKPSENSIPVSDPVLESAAAVSIAAPLLTENSRNKKDSNNNYKNSKNDLNNNHKNVLIESASIVPNSADTKSINSTSTSSSIEDPYSKI